MDRELLCLMSPVDLLGGPVPSCLPSPQLHPDPVLQESGDLIQFEEQLSGEICLCTELVLQSNGTTWPLYVGGSYETCVKSLFSYVYMSQLLPGKVSDSSNKPDAAL